MTSDERRHYLRMAGTPLTLLALVLLIAVAIRAGWKAVSAPIPPPPLTPVSYTHLTLPTNREV